MRAMQRTKERIIGKTEDKMYKIGNNCPCLTVTNFSSSLFIPTLFPFEWEMTAEDHHMEVNVYAGWEWKKLNKYS